MTVPSIAHALARGGVGADDDVGGDVLAVLLLRDLQRQPHRGERGRRLLNRRADDGGVLDRAAGAGREVPGAGCRAEDGEHEEHDEQGSPAAPVALGLLVRTHGRLRARRRCRAGRGGPAGRERRGGSAGRELGRHAHVDDEGVVGVDERTRRRQGRAHAADVGEEVEGVLVAERGIPSRRRDDQRIDLGRDVAADGRRGRDVAVHVLVGHAQRALAGVRHLAGDHLEEEDAGCVDVGPAIGLAPLDLLRRQVGDRADDHPLRDALAVRLDRSREAEVGDLHATVIRDQDVLRLDVAVDEAGGMRGRQRLEHGIEEDERLRGGQRPVLPEDVAQGAARHVLHRQVDQPVVLALVVHRDDVAVGQPGGRLGLPLEPRDEGLVVREVGMHDLEGDDPVEPQVERLVDRRHAAAGKQGEHPITAVDGRADERVLTRRLHPRESRLARLAVSVATPSSRLRPGRRRHPGPRAPGSRAVRAPRRPVAR